MSMLICDPFKLRSDRFNIVDRSVPTLRMLSNSKVRGGNITFN